MLDYFDKVEELTREERLVQRTVRTFVQEVRLELEDHYEAGTFPVDVISETGKLAEMATQMTSSQLLVHRLATLKGRSERRPEQVSMAKRHNIRMARDQTRVTGEILGRNGITIDYSPMRHMANVETVYTYEGAHDIHTLILGEGLTGIPAHS